MKIKNFKNFDDDSKILINESMITKGNEISGYNSGQDVPIERYFPDFYEQNKERIDQGKIKFFYDPWATEVGCLIDLETFQNYIIDTRS